MKLFSRWIWRTRQDSGSCHTVKCCPFIKRSSLTSRMIKVYVACTIGMFSYSFNVTLLFPFLPFMVQSLLPEISEESTGKYAGVVVAAYSIGQFLSNFVWGAVADSKGRKPVIIVSSVLMAISTVAFGLSVSYPMAIFTRFLTGFFNGIMGMYKAVVSESSNDKTQAIGMSAISCAIISGHIFGPAVSGVIADPVQQFGISNSTAVYTFFTKFPYSLPCFVSAFIFLVAIGTVLIMLPETLVKKRSSQGEDQFCEEKDNLHDPAGILEEETVEQNVSPSVEAQSDPSSPPVPVEEQSDPSFVLSLTPSVAQTHPQALDGDATATGDHDTSLDTPDRQVLLDKAQLHTTTQPSTKILSLKLWKIRFHKLLLAIKKTLKIYLQFIKNRSVLLSVIIYATYSLFINGFTEVFSLWCATSLYYGGLGFSLHDIGVVLSIAGVFVLFLSFIYYPLLEKKFGALNAFQISIVIQLPAIVLLPSLHYIQMYKPAVLWLLLITTVILTRLLMMSCFSAIFTFINNSVTFDKLGSVNGFAICWVSISRTIAPLYAGSLYSVSLTSNLSFPLDYHLIFVIFGVIMLVVMTMVASLPSNVNKQKTSSHDMVSGEDVRDQSDDNNII